MSPSPKNQSSQRNSPHPVPLSSSTSYLSDELRILMISVRLSWRVIKTAYRKLARVYHPDKYDNLPEKKFSREKEHDLFKALSNAYDKLGSLEFVV